MKTLFILLFMTTATALSQSLPYSSITAPGESFSAGTVAARMIDGLGFRYFWATEGLRESDLAYKPGPDARTCQETLEHIYEMSFLVINSTLIKMNIPGQDVKVPFAQMRKKTLENFKNASDILRKSSDDDMKNLKFLFKDNKKTYEYPFWNMINGPIEDCIWHAGQIVSFRRSSGNPITEKDFFAGK